jgi:hypothetical protein
MRRPSPLQVVAWLFLASGLSAAVSIAGALLFEGRINLNINIIGFRPLSWHGVSFNRARLTRCDFGRSGLAILGLVPSTRSCALYDSAG